MSNRFTQKEFTILKFGFHEHELGVQASVLRDLLSASIDKYGEPPNPHLAETTVFFEFDDMDRLIVRVRAWVPEE